jgi:CTP synthase
VCSGTSPDDRLVELIELPEHPFFIASQFHPEFKSRPLRPQPLFREFVKAALERGRARLPEGGDEADSPEPDDAPVERAGRRFTA